MGDDFGLPPLEEILGRSKGDCDNNSAPASEISRAPRFYDSRCVVKEEWDGEENIQVEESAGPDGIHHVACKYNENPYCRVMYRDCPHSGSRR